MANINTAELITACERINQRCIRIADTQHGSVWLFDKLMRYFTSETACESITIPVIFNTPMLGCEGTATIGRDGSLTMAKTSTL